MKPKITAGYLARIRQRQGLDRPSRTALPLLLLLVFTLFSRLLTEAHEPYGWDAFNYVLGVIHYHPLEDMPHFPGYPFRILAGKLLHTFFVDPHDALVFWSVLESVIGVWLVAAFTRHRVAPLFGWEGERAEWFGLLAGTLVAVNPMAWLFGSIALGNISGISIAVLAAWSILAAQGSRWKWVASAALIGLLMGFRLEVALLGVLWLRFALRDRLPVGWLLLSLAAGVVGVAAWMVPVGLLAGSFGDYWSRGMATLGDARRESIAATGGMGPYYVLQVERLAAYLLLAAGLALPVLLVVPKRTLAAWQGIPAKVRSLLTWWIVPTALVLFMGHLQPGYLMVLEPAFAVFIAALLWGAFRNKPWRNVAVGAVVALSFAWFFAPLPHRATLPYSEWRIEQNDDWLSHTRRLVKEQRLGETTGLVHYGDDVYPWRASVLEFPDTRAFQLIDFTTGRRMVMGRGYRERNFDSIPEEGPLDTMRVFTHVGRVLVFGPADSARIAADFPDFIPLDTLRAPRGDIPVLLRRPDTAHF